MKDAEKEELRNKLRAQAIKRTHERISATKPYMWLWKELKELSMATGAPERLAESIAWTVLLPEVRKRHPAAADNTELNTLREYALRGGALSPLTEIYKTGIPKKRVTPLLRQLEAEGIVERYKKPGDFSYVSKRWRLTTRKKATS